MAILYCAGCNENFEASTDGCPRCGMKSVPGDDPAIPETVLVEPGTHLAGNASIGIDQVLFEGQFLHIYECERMLGRGGMGIVYLARNVDLHRRCALKILSPRRTLSDVDYIGRFENEARAAAAIVHPNIVTTHAIGRHDSHHYLEMEFVAGRSLQKEIDDSGALGPLRSTEMACGIASGLAAAHRLGIVHGDLKPDNILVTPAGRPKIGDFGLAKRVQSLDAGPVQLAGTPHYMAPEIFDAQPASPASDVFALGVCYYLMLTGRLPFEGDSLNSLRHAVLAGEYVPVRVANPGVPLDMAECVSLMLSRSPENRPADGAVASMLLQAVMGSARDLGTLVHDAFFGVTFAECEERPEGYLVRLNLPDGRRQSVYLENSDHPAGDRLLLIYSVCCPASPDFYEDALRLNAHVLHGGLAIRDIDGRPCFVMVDTYPRGTVEAEEIRRSVVEVGSQADRTEYLLTGRDVN